MKPPSLPKAAKRCAIYCRISDDKMEDQAGVERQEQDMRKLAAKSGWVIVDTYVDNSKSAWKRNRKRPQWDRMLEDVKAGLIDVIAVYHPDRLMRQPRDLETLIEVSQQGVTVYGTVGEYDLTNADHVMVLRIIVSVACKASDDASRRQKSKQREMAERGEFKGGSRPFGFEADGVTHRPFEADIVKRLVWKFINGSTLRQCTAWMNEQDVPRIAGKTNEWLEISVRQLLDSPRMAGIREFHGDCDRPRNKDACPRSCEGQRFPAKWEAIIPVEWWLEAEARLNGNRQAWETRKGTWRVFEATGLMKCGNCGSNMHSTGGAKVGYICLSRQGGCGKMHIGKDNVEKLLNRLVRVRIVQSGLNGTRKIARLDPEAEAEIRKDQAQLEELASAYGQKDLTMGEWMSAKRPIDDRIREAQGRLTERAVPLRLAKRITSPDMWDVQTPEERREIYRELFNGIVISQGTKGVFNPGRVEVNWAI